MDSALEDQRPVSGGAIKPTEGPPSQKKSSLERLVIYAVAGVILIIFLHAFAIPYLSRLSQSDKKSVDQNTEQPPLTETPQPLAVQVRPMNNQASPHSDNLPARKELSITDIIQANRESVVTVKTPSGIGSGFFVNREGHIVTNKHVLQNTDGAEIKTINGNVYRIQKVIHEDQAADLVIALTDATSRESKPVSINPALPAVGEKVIVIGSPLGLEQTVSDGIVSALRSNQQSIEFIQVTAPVSPGNSGGPLLNMRGEVIGVATFQYSSGQNLNFCVSASRIAGLQQGLSPSASQASGNQRQMPQSNEVYCYVDSNGQVSFVNWKTGMLISRPDGSLDIRKYEQWVLEQIGGNPDNINPEREAREDLERNRESLFKSVFPDRSFNDSNLTPAEKEWLERRYYRHYVEAYNQSIARRNDAIRKYRTMMNEFIRFNASRR
jgi:S1-C subfamily serine protease